MIWLNDGEKLIKAKIIGKDGIELKNVMKEFENNEQRYNILITLKVIKEALSNSDICDREKYKTDILHTLSPFFNNVEEDYKRIYSILDNPYCMDFIKGMYIDYHAFISIFPYIDFKEEESYCLEDLKTIVSLEEKNGILYSKSYKILNDEQSAKNNSKILVKTKEIITRINK